MRHKESYKRVYFDGETLFALYCTEIGKPHNLIVWYQKNGWLDLWALQWAGDIPELRSFPIPRYLETIFRDYNDIDDEGYTN